MARAKKTTEAIIGDYPHPRTRDALFGHCAAEQLFLQTYSTGRPHHAFLIGGPLGIGKATFAYRLARFLLAHPDPLHRDVIDAQDLFVSADHKVFHEVAQNAHPDCHHVELEQEKGKAKKFISVDAVRDLSQAMQNTSGTGGWRVAIVDAADELNINAANALLKILEEPPPLCMFLLISHQPGQLLPTLRSRCQKLTLQPLNDDNAVKAARSVMPDMEVDVSGLKHAHGSVRALLNDNESAGQQDRHGLSDLLEDLPTLGIKKLQSWCERIARQPDHAFDEAVTAIGDYCHEMAMQNLSLAPHLAEFIAHFHNAAQSVSIYNLDKKSFLINQFNRLALLAPRKAAA